MGVELKFLMIGLLFLTTIGAGIWLSRSGRPLNPLIFNLHKFLALGAVIYSAVRVYQFIKSSGVTVRLADLFSSQGLFTILILATSLLVIALFATGAFLSRPKPANPALKAIHITGTVLILFSAAGLIYQLSVGR
jgi:hypothetical protein